MAYCPTAPGHYQNQCWVIMNGVLWHSLETFSQEVLRISIIHKMGLKNMFVISLPHSQRVNALSWITSCTCWEQCTHIDGLIQDCSISCALEMEKLQSCTKPSIYLTYLYWNRMALQNFQFCLTFFPYISTQWCLMLQMTNSCFVTNPFTNKDRFRIAFKDTEYIRPRTTVLWGRIEKEQNVHDKEFYYRNQNKMTIRLLLYSYFFYLQASFTNRD